jgi:hypothetical protein
MGPRRVNKLVRDYQAKVEKNGFDFFFFLATAVQLSEEQRRRALLNPDVARVISYADPTGEKATNDALAADPGGDKARTITRRKALHAST